MGSEGEGASVCTSTYRVNHTPRKEDVTSGGELDDHGDESYRI